MSEPTFPVVSAVVTFHGEGLLAHKTLLGLERVRRYSEAQGIPVELIAVLDCADIETQHVVKSSPVLRAEDQILEVSNRDLGASRNSGISVARGDYIGIFDGDDYYSKNWLVQALAVVREKQGEVIVHPEYLITFGTIQSFSIPWDMDDRTDYSLSNCLALQPWVVCSFGKKDLYLRQPYQRAEFLKTGFGYEDWHWNLELVSQGVRHVSAKKTALFYRRKPVSMLTSMQSADAVVRPSEFFNHPERWDKPVGTTLETVEHEEIDDQSHIKELLKGKDWLEFQWKAVQGELLAKDAYLADVLKGKDWLEFQWKAVQGELLAKDAYLADVLKGKDWLESQWKAAQAELAEVEKSNELAQAQLGILASQLERLQSALPVRLLRKLGVISHD